MASTSDLNNQPKDWPDKIWQEFIDNCHPKFYQLARHRGLNPADAADAAQNAFLRVQELAGTFDPERPLWGWANAIAIYVVMELKKKNAVRIKHEERAKKPDHVEYELDLAEETDLFYQEHVLDALASSHMAPETLSLAGEALSGLLSIKEIAARRKVKPEQVTMAKHRAIKFLRQKYRSKPSR